MSIMSESPENLTDFRQDNQQNLSLPEGTPELRRNVSWEDIKEDDYIFDDPKLQMTLIVLYSLVFSFCFLGNLTVVLVTKLHWKMRGVPKFCLGNLAFANLCVSIFCIYQNLSLYLMDSWIFGDLMCKMYHFVNSLSHTASIFILVVISIERYLAILHPFKCRRLLTMKKLRLIILGVWIGSALLCCPRLYYIIIIKNVLPRSRDEPRRYEVICSIGSSQFDSRVADWMQFLLLFLLPILIITVLYTKIAFSLGQRQNFHDPFPEALPDRLRLDPAFQTITDTLSGTEEHNAEHSSGNLETTTPGNTCMVSCKNRNLINSESRSESEATNEIGHLSEQCIQPSPTADIIITDSSSRAFEAEGSVIKLSKQFSLFQSRYPFVVSNRSKSSSKVMDKPGSSSRHAGVVRMLVLIVVTFTFCNLPFHLRKLYQNHLYARSGESMWTELSAPFTFLLMYINCAINPFLYAFMSKSFRTCTLDLAKCKLKKPASV